jgi:hypothetical protein
LLWSNLMLYWTVLQQRVSIAVCDLATEREREIVESMSRGERERERVESMSRGSHHLNTVFLSMGEIN